MQRSYKEASKDFMMEYLSQVVSLFLVLDFQISLLGISIFISQFGSEGFSYLDPV